MNILVPIFIATMLAHCASPAPSDLHQLEMSMINKLHKPWFTPDKPSQYPRKGEYPCKGGICRTKFDPTKIKCEECQYAKPLELGNWE